MNPPSPAAELRYARFCGAEIASQFDALARLRMEVFRAFPYLYKGDLAYEMAYLKTYSEAPRSLLFAVFDGLAMVGATTCIPLIDETPEVQKPFLETGMHLHQIFYFGESILLPAYRNRGLGHRFFEEREAHAASFGNYALTCFCAVERPRDHALRPADHRPLDGFWMQRGYEKAPQLRSEFDWQDIGEATSTLKQMVYWTRHL
jgi:GNAT superfamily N-acetyltransferase